MREKVREIIDLRLAQPRQRLAHRVRVAQTHARAKALQRDQQVVLALAADAWYLAAAGEVGAVAAGAVVLERECAAAFEAGRIARRRCSRRPRWAPPAAAAWR
ncbi:MAG: hypothetical protein U1F67_17315 [Rubrivivax sp.]